MLTAYLNSNLAAVDKAISVDTTPVRFEVEPGHAGAQWNLVAAGLIEDDLLFEAYVRVNGLAARLEAGTFILAPSMTMAEIVEALQQAEAASVTITIPEGWRLEQVVEYLDEAGIFAGTEGALEQYHSQVTGGDLTGLDPARYAFLQDRPAGAGLEGYLFPETYEIPAEGTLPADVLSRQLDTFAVRVIPAYEEAVQAGTTAYDLHTVLTLASIVEREAVVPEERPDIAAVYLNRLAVGMRPGRTPPCSTLWATRRNPVSGGRRRCSWRSTAASSARITHT